MITIAITLSTSAVVVHYQKDDAYNKDRRHGKGNEAASLRLRTPDFFVFFHNNNNTDFTYSSAVQVQFSFTGAVDS